MNLELRLCGNLLLKGTDILVLSPTPTYPPDQGNRRRVYIVCRVLKELGARVHFVYYPLEWWFTWIPRKHIDIMSGQWDSFYLLPITRSIQPPPKNGLYHEIDEWWDCFAIEPMLNWLFKRCCYDAFLVNYAYLSKALEIAPRNVLKILDTHDKFTNRRYLFDQLGMPPEFFYTTRDQEKIALDRADLILAIKDNEAEFFRTLTSKPVITLPHIEPKLNIELKKTPEDEKYLVVGIVGSRNKINYLNSILFLQKALPLISKKDAPIKIKFAGSMCSDLAKLWGDNLPHPVELFGYFKDPEEFYSSIDVILAPLSFGTGLKIKVVEAFAAGVPVVAHRHAVEGIPVTHPFHKCNSMDEIAERIVQLSHDKSLLDDLRKATYDTYVMLRITATNSYNKLASIIKSVPKAVIVVNSVFWEQKSAYSLYVLELIRNLAKSYKIVFYSDQPIIGNFNSLAGKFYGLSQHLKLIFSPTAGGSMEELGMPISNIPLSSDIDRFDDLCNRYKVRIAWLTDIPKSVEDLFSNIHENLQCYVGVDPIRLLGKSGEELVVTLCRRFPKIKIVGSLSEDIEPLRSIVQNPYLRISYWRSANLRFSKLQPSDDNIIILWIACTSSELSIIGDVIRIIESAKAENDTSIKLILSNKFECNNVLNYNDLTKLVKVTTSQEELLEDLTKIYPVPRLVLDLCGNAYTFYILREILEQNFRVKWIPFNGNPLNPGKVESLVNAFLKN